MFIIIEERGEFSDYCTNVVGYVTEEEQAQEIIDNKNKEFGIITEWKEKYYEFIRQWDKENGFIHTNINFNIDDEEDDAIQAIEIKRYNVWCDNRNLITQDWFKKQQVSKELMNEIFTHYQNHYFYKKIEKLI